MDSSEILGGDQPPWVEVALPLIPSESGAVVGGGPEALGVPILVTTAEEAMASTTTEGGNSCGGGNAMEEEARGTET